MNPSPIAAEPVRRNIRRFRALQALGSLLICLVWTCSCTQTADRDTCIGACRHRLQLETAEHKKKTVKQEEKGEMRSREGQLQQLETSLMRELAEINAQKKARVEAAGGQDEELRVIAEYDKKIELKQKEYEEKFEQAREAIDHEERVMQEGAPEQKELAEREDEQAVSDCADTCLEKETSQRKANCQIKATTLAEFDACR